jgi:3-oxoacyl-[acyl-carrier-protein] synthase II
LVAEPRVAITGIGVVSPFGIGRDLFWSSVSCGVSGTRAVTEFDASELTSRVLASVPDAALVSAGADAADLGDETSTNGHGRADPRRYAKVSRIAVLAAREAFADAGIAPNTDGIGVIVGSGAGGIDVAERQYGDYYRGDRHRVSPYAIPVSIVGIVSSEISIALGLRGISHVLSTGCTSSTDAIGYAASLIRHGEADVLLTGGADACATAGMLFGFCRMRVASTRYNDRPAQASRPFDRGRDGFVLGEGAWLMTVEREDRARARGAKVYATIDGYGSTCDAYHRVQMDPDGTEIVRAMTLALDRSGRSRDEIGYVNYHGTSTMLNDAVEARCVDEVHDRASAGCERGRWSRDRCPGAVPRPAATHHQPRRPGSGLRPRFHSERRAARGARGRALQLSRIRIQEQRARHRTCGGMNGAAGCSTCSLLAPDRPDRSPAGCWRAPEHACSSWTARPFRDRNCAATR